jgi:hypothetical protein
MSPGEPVATQAQLPESSHWFRVSCNVAALDLQDTL